MGALVLSALLPALIFLVSVILLMVLSPILFVSTIVYAVRDLRDGHVLRALGMSPGIVMLAYLTWVCSVQFPLAMLAGG